MNAGELGTEIQSLCRENPKGAFILTDYGPQVQRMMSNLPKKALMNSDQSVNNFGWRITEKGKEIVVFDLTDILR